MEIAILNIIDKIYPIGSYYETSDETFDPNVSWGGYWIKDTDGLVTVGAGSIDDTTIGARAWVENQNICGSSQVQLNIDQLATHTHRAYNFVFNPAQATGNKHTVNVGSGSSVLAYDVNGDIDLKVNNEGGNEPHNNVQPSIGVIRWHRVNACIYTKFSWVPSEDYTNSQEGSVKYFNNIDELRTYIATFPFYEIRIGNIGKEVTTIYSLFEADFLVEKIDLSQLDTSNITSTSRLFYNCTNLKEVNLSTNDFSNVDTTTEMLNGVPSDCVFIVKDQITKDWLLSIRSDLTGIQIK